ncbi:MAG: hypothetical protein A4E57_04540 [Syntrophorhabdaceae bacterium PtaU1.Bin034]|nr:MAG: hypothetical protein A4E57_04540 [Syntrophorhabdaceae bacterium PtaU1.Bin034]
MPSLLAMPGKEKQRMKMIEQALKDQAPRKYRELKKSNKLQEFLEDYEQQMIESYNEAESELSSQVIGPKGPEDYMERAQALEMGMKRIWEETLETWLEFNDPK